MTRNRLLVAAVTTAAAISVVGAITASAGEQTESPANQLAGTWDMTIDRPAPLSDPKSLEFSRDGARLGGTTIDERGFAIRIWDWPAGNEILKLRDSGLRIALSPDGRLIATVRPRQPVPFVHVWALDPELLLEIARDRVTRKLTEEECARYLQRPCTEESSIRPIR